MSWTINEQAKTSETQYFTASYIPGLAGLSLVADQLLSSITTNPTVNNATAVSLPPTSSSGVGTGAVFTLVSAAPGGPITGITVTVPGSGYAIGDTITFTIADLILGFGGATTDLVITLKVGDTVIAVLNGGTVDSEKINVAGYTAGTISFSISPPPNGGGGWTVPSTLEMTILGTIDTNSFIAVTLVISAGDLNSTFYVDWNIPLEKVALRVNNNTSTPTGKTITVGGIRLITESNGGGLGYVSTSGASVGPGGMDPEIQFNDGGVFGGASGALYDNTVNSPVGQVLLGGLAEDLGTIQALEMNPILSFQADTNTGMFYSTIDPDGNPSALSNISFSVNGNEALRIASTTQEDLPTLAINGCVDSGIFEAGSNNIGISAGGLERCRATNATGTGTISVGGFTVGKVGNPMALARLSATIANSWEDGHEGDSTKLWFSPSDFFPSAGPTPGPLDPAPPFSTETYNVSCRDVTRGPVRGISFGGTTSGSTALCAMKLIPKGFQIGEGDAFVFTNVSAVSSAALASIASTELRIYGQILNIATGISAPAPLLNSTTYTTNAGIALSAGGAVVGNGLTSICIYWDPGQRLDIGAGNRVLLGAYLEMVRI